MKSENEKKTSIDKIIFFISAFLFTLLLGALLHHKNIFPGPLVKLAMEGYTELSARTDKYQRSYYDIDSYKQIKNGPVNDSYQDDRLTLLTSIGLEKMNVTIIDKFGKEVHRWPVSWYDIWPNPEHLTEAEKPKSGAGTHIHGLILLNNGDIIFNFEFLGSVRLNPCGKVLWRLPYRTHHAIFKESENSLWLLGAIIHQKKIPSMPLYKTPYMEHTLLNISNEGKILKEISLLKMLKNSPYSSLLYVNLVRKVPGTIGKDPLHVNDVELFPENMAPGHYKPGDMLVSIRNLNAILVVDKEQERIKDLIIGPFVRQHDPDFIDGNTISIFDNYFIDKADSVKSRIITYNAVEKTFNVHFQASEENGFSTWRMGKHQVLENGNMLIAESERGRAFEIDPNGKVVWNFINRLGTDHVGILEQADRLDHQFNKAFFKQAVANCSQ